MRKAAHLILVLAALAAAGCAASTAPSSKAPAKGAAIPAARTQPGEALIGFDGLVTGGPGGAGALVIVNSQFAGQGVTFNNVSAIDYSKGPAAIAGFAHSGTVAVEPCVGAEFCTAPVAATFTAAQRRVRVWVGFSSPLAQPLQVQLKALNASSTVVGTSSVTLAASSAATPVRAPLAVDAGSATITQVQVSIPGGGSGLAVDDVEFSTAGPAPVCSATGVPGVQLDLPAGGTVVQSDGFLLKGTVNNNGAPIVSASLEAVGNTTQTTTLFPAPIGPGGGPFGPSFYSGLLASGPQTIVVSATNCRGTGTAEAGVFWCRPDTPVSGSASVSSYAELKAAVDGCKKDIWVENGRQIDLAAVADHRAGAPDYVLHLRDGVTLASGRSPTERGALLYMSRRLPEQPVMLDLGSNTHVTGLRLGGYDQSDTTDRQDGTAGIAVRNGVDNVLIDNNELYGWPNAGVLIERAPNARGTAARIHVTGNFIHNNVQCNHGYGVVVGGTGFAQIDRNVFNFDRHDVADDGLPGTGYIAELNFSLTSGPTCPGATGRYYNQHYDMHGTGSNGYGGTAGDYVDIRRNTIRGDQDSKVFGIGTRPAFELRGTPRNQAIFEENAVAHSHSFTAVAVRGVSRFRLQTERKLIIRNNNYDVDTALQLGVGDFNGDGQADVFQSVGTVWVYSPSGRREWQFLNDSSLRLDRLALADFNGDGKTDVFSQNGDQWRVSYGGTGPWQALPAGSSIPIAYYRFGDFDGDKKADVFRANGSHWYMSSGGATAWKQIETSSLTAGELRFGDFNGDGKTDVFSLANGQWSVSYGGTTAWQRLNRRLSDDLRELVFADFNGDGRTDVARDGDDRWEVSYGGTRAWRTLNTGALPPLALTLPGDFTGDHRADALQFATLGSLGILPSLTRFKLSSGGVSGLVPWSLADMR